MTKVNYADKFDKAQNEETIEIVEVPEVEEETTKTATVICDLLNLRNAPNGEIISKLPKGTVVQIESIVLHDRLWASVTTASGLSGYAMTQYLKY